VPAAAVIPAPIAYIKVVAVKTLVVESLLMTTGHLLRICTFCHWHYYDAFSGFPLCVFVNVTLRKLECFKQA
jgi:hypothetical protein